jgi:uncharacterized protein (TIGR02118 family)
LTTIMILLKRQDHLSFEEFEECWLGKQKEMAAQLPGLKRACFNLTQGDADNLYDGVSEIWFDSLADFESAFQPDIGKKVTAARLHLPAGTEL